MNERKEDCVVIVSGGIDSVTLLYWLMAHGKRPYVITFDYGQKHAKEIKYAKWHTDALGLKHIIVKLDIKPLISKSALIDEDIELPTGDYTPESQQITVVPNRNMIMLSMAIALAENEGLNEVYYAAHKNDETVYPDCAEEFVLAMTTASYLATYNHVKVIAPFVNMYKKDIVLMGRRVGVPFRWTWSCYRGSEKACGLCNTCIERLKAFKANGIEDPIEYEVIPDDLDSL